MTRTDALEVAVALHRAAVRLLRTLRVTDAETGVSAPKLSALSVLTFGGPMSLSALAGAEQVTLATMSKLVSALEAEGLVAKYADRQDRRGVRIEATAKGRALMEEGRKRRLEALRRRLAKLTRVQRGQLYDAAEIMLKLTAGKTD